jgi:hypothetical protein
MASVGLGSWRSDFGRGKVGVDPGRRRSGSAHSCCGSVGSCCGSEGDCLGYGSSGLGSGRSDSDAAGSCCSGPGCRHASAGPRRQRLRPDRHGPRFVRHCHISPCVADLRSEPVHRRAGRDNVRSRPSGPRLPPNI